MITILLDRQRNAKFNLSAAKRFEQKTGKSYCNIKPADISLDDINVLVWASLVWEDPELTVEQVADMVEFGQLRSLLDYISGSQPNPI